MGETTNRRRRGSWVLRILLSGLALAAVSIVAFFALGALGLGPQVPAEDRQAVTLEPRLPSSTGGAGRLLLDLRAHRIEIAPAERGTPLRVEAEYDAASHVLSDTLETGGAGDWTYSVGLGPSFRGARRVLVAHRAPPTVRVSLPPDLPLSIEARLGGGHATLELGGLDLRSVQVAFDDGNHRLSFGAPTARPLSSLVLESTSGRIEVSGIGNASPASLRADHELGQLALELDGSWQGGSDLELGVRKFGNIELLLEDSPPLAVTSTELGNIGTVDLPDDLPVVPESELAAAVRLTAVARGGSLRVLR